MIVTTVCASMMISMAQGQERFRLLTERTSGDMERALNDAGAAGYRFAGSQGGKSTFGKPNESVVVMVRDPEGRKFRYVVSATIRTGTMERELNEVPPEFSFVGMTAFLAEGAAILEAEVPAGSGPDTSAGSLGDQAR